MAWRIEFSETALRQLAALDRQAQARILRFLRERVAKNEEPRRFGAPLRKSLAGLWKWRVGDFRIVADIEEKRVLVTVVRVGHRSRIYGGH